MSSPADVAALRRSASSLLSSILCRCSGVSMTAGLQAPSGVVSAADARETAGLAGEGVLAQGIISLYLLRVYAWMEPPAW